MKRIDPNSLRTPDIDIAGLQIWILNRAYDEEDDYWDGNWLNVIVHCGSACADVWLSGTLIHGPELARWLDALNPLNQTLSGSAKLDCIEPNVMARVKLDRGRGELKVKLMPDSLRESHTFRFDVDQSHVRVLISELHALLRAWPIVGKR